MFGQSEGPSRIKKGCSAADKTKTLLRELSSDDEDDALADSTPSNPSKPWLKEFELYLNAVDELPDGLSIVQWWAVSI